MSQELAPNTTPALPVLPWPVRAKKLLRTGAPLAVWLAAAMGAAVLYVQEEREGQMLAYAEVVEIDLTPEIGGRLTGPTLEIGRSVTAGEVLVALDPAAADERLRYARADAERARARAAAQEKRLASAAGTPAALCDADPRRLQMEIDRLTAEQAADRGEREALAVELARLEALAEKQILTDDRLKQLGLKASTIDKRVQARRAQLEGYQACAGATVAAELALAELALAKAERARAQHELHAPVSGVISEVAHHSGEWIRAGTSVAKLVDPRLERVTAYISGRHVPAVAIGARVTLAPRERTGEPLSGTVIALGPRFERVPLRLQFIPTIPQWGRIATIKVDPPGALIAGELYNVGFQP